MFLSLRLDYDAIWDRSLKFIWKKQTLHVLKLRSVFLGIQTATSCILTVICSIFLDAIWVSYAVSLS